MAPDPIGTWVAAVAERPVTATIGALVLVAVLAYAVLVVQQVLEAVWFLVSLFLVVLAWRFVIAVESIASAIDRYVDDRVDD